jgi:hypothetical protein
MNRRKSPLRMEFLENRVALAGDVAAALEGSLLVVARDQLANDLAIVQNAAGDVTLTGLNGTTVNGMPSRTFIRPNLNAAEIRLEGGHDRLSITGLRTGNDLNVDLGAGNDTANIQASVGGNLGVKGEAGNDSVTVRGSRIGLDLNVEMGIGTANVNLRNLTVGNNTTVISDAGNDRVTLSNLRMAGDLNVETKAGADNVQASLISARSFTAITDLGADIVSATDISVSEDVSVETGDHADRVTLTRVSAGNSVKVNTDSGNDVVVATDVAAAVDAIFTGDAGVDSFDNNGVTAGAVFEFKEFEVLL